MATPYVPWRTWRMALLLWYRCSYQIFTIVVWPTVSTPMDLYLKNNLIKHDQLLVLTPNGRKGAPVYCMFELLLTWLILRYHARYTRMLCLLWTNSLVDPVPFPTSDGCIVHDLDHAGTVWKSKVQVRPGERMRTHSVWGIPRVTPSLYLLDLELKTSVKMKTWATTITV